MAQSVRTPRLGLTPFKQRNTTGARANNVQVCVAQSVCTPRLAGRRARRAGTRQTIPVVPPQLLAQRGASTGQSAPARRFVYLCVWPVSLLHVHVCIAQSVGTPRLAGRRARHAGTRQTIPVVAPELLASRGAGPGEISPARRLCGVQPLRLAAQARAEDAGDLRGSDDAGHLRALGDGAVVHGDGGHDGDRHARRTPGGAKLFVCMYTYLNTYTYV